MPDRSPLSWSLSDSFFDLFQIGSTVLQNELGKRLPVDYLAQFPEGLEIIYAVIPTIKNIQDPVLEAEVKKAFADSLQLLC